MHPNIKPVDYIEIYILWIRQAYEQNNWNSIKYWNYYISNHLD